MPRNRPNPKKQDKFYYLKNYLQRSGLDLTKIKEIINILIVTHQNIWDIRTTLGKINVFSSLSEHKAELFLDNDDSGNDKLITQLLNNSYKYRDCGSDPICNWFIRLHQLTPKAGYNIWKGLDKSTRNFYKTVIYPKRRCLPYIKVLFSTELMHINITEVPISYLGAHTPIC